MTDPPRGTVVIAGSDIGVVGAVTVEVNGQVVCRLDPVTVVRTMTQNGRTETALTLNTHAVDWRKEIA